MEVPVAGRPLRYRDHKKTPLTTSFSKKTIHVSGHTGKKMALRFGNDRSADLRSPEKRAPEDTVRSHAVLKKYKAGTPEERLISGSDYERKQL